MGLYTERCKICSWSVSGENQKSLKDAVDNHIKEEHESLVEKHKTLLKDVIAHLDQQEAGTKKFTKKQIRELKNRVSEELGEPKEAEPENEKDE